MTLVLIAISFYLLYPMLLLIIMSFNVAADVFIGPAQWGLGNWTRAWSHPQLLNALWHSIMVWGLVALIAFPIAITIAWTLGRTRIPFGHGLEYGFWIAYMFPSLSSTIGWMMILHPDVGFANTALEALPFVDKGPFNIFSIPGIVWAKLMGDGIAYLVMLLTPAFRNMNRSLEEAARVSGATDIRTMLRVTIPMMVAPITLVFALQLIRMFQGFETEFLLGNRWNFYVYSTLIHRLVSLEEAPQYGMATVLASITFLVIAVVLPFQRWIINRRHYITVSGNYRPGMVDLRRWRWAAFGTIVFLLLTLTALPLFVLVLGSFMARAGFFETTPLWTLRHWELVFSEPVFGFWRAFRTTLTLSITAAIFSPLLFSVIAYIIVRSNWAGRGLLDTVIWISAAIPGILSGLGLLFLFLDVPVFRPLYGSIWALIIVVIISGNTTGVNLFKGVLVQIGQDLEEAARVAGAGWLRTYTHVVIPVLMPTMVLVGVLNFVLAAGATSSIVLLAARDTTTLSLLTLNLAGADTGEVEAAGIVSMVIMAMTLGMALLGRIAASRMGLQRTMDAASRPVKEIAVGRKEQVVPNTT